MSHARSFGKILSTLRVGVPLVAVAVLATACGSSGSSASAPAPTSSASSPASGGSSAATVDVHTIDGKTYLTDSSGRSLYLFASDTGTKSTCSGACATAWPPLTAKSALTAGAGAMVGDLGTITRSDGTKQVTYNAHPLYYFVGDSGAGQTNGEGKVGFGAPWYLLAPSGQQVTSLSAGSSKAAAPSSSASSSTGSNAGGGWS